MNKLMNFGTSKDYQLFFYYIIYLRYILTFNIEVSRYFSLAIQFEIS